MKRRLAVLAGSGALLMAGTAAGNTITIVCAVGAAICALASIATYRDAR